MASEIVGFVGLGSMGLGMAYSLVREGFHVQGFDVSKMAMGRFCENGGVKTSTAREASKGAAAVVIMVTNETQVDDVLFGTEGAISGMPNGSVIMLCSTVSPVYVQKLWKCLPAEKNIFLVDAPVSGGFARAASGTLTIMASGTTEALEKAKPVLSAMSEKLFIVDGAIGSGSKIKMVNQLLAGVHLAAAAEAMVLGAKAGLNTRILYNIISNAAGSSWVFVDRVPQMVNGDYTPHAALDIFVKDLGIVLGEAKSLPFPLPLTAVAHQQFIHGSACGYGEEADAAIVKIWEKTAGISVVAQDEDYSPEKTAEEIVSISDKVEQIGFIGLGAMGFGMAVHLVKENFRVSGFDVYQPTLTRFAKAGGLTGTSPAEVAKGAQVLIVMVTNEDQAQSVLFGNGGAVAGLPDGASIILSSTVSPGFIKVLEKQLAGQNRDLQLVDAPVSGGVVKAANGKLTIMAAGTDDALKRTGAVLSALSEKLYIIKGGAGAGSSVKMVNQLLAGVHIAAAAEAMAFGARLGLNTQKLYDIVSNAGGYSWMFGNRVPHMLENDYTPHSALDIFVKDLGIVLHESKNLNIPLQISAVAHQQFLLGSAAGWGRHDDAAVVKIFEKLTGISVEAKVPILLKEETLKSLPPEWPVDPIEEIQRLEDHGVAKVLVVLDDDPTGTQTVHGVTVLTEWSIESLVEQFRKRPSCFFILTNSRALSSDKAILLTKEICKNLESAAASENTGYTVVLRGDSTLRGHFPEEADAAASVIEETDAWIICPFFLQGGRYTIANVHYVADGDRLVPAGRTEFAKDAAFGYKASNLCEWIEEKTKGRVAATNVASVSIETIRKGGPDAVCLQLCNLSKGSICIVNAASERDISVFAAGMIKAEMQGKQFLCRTAASFVSARIGIKPKEPITPKQLGIFGKQNGGLIVVGSYVPKTTKQVKELKAQCGHFLRSIEVRVDAVAMKSIAEREEEISRTVEVADTFLKSRNDTLIMTSRELVLGSSASESLEINSKVSSALVEIVRRIQTRPRYLLAKGGITSSDLATKAMEASRAEVVGQALAGVPLWQLGPESRHPHVPYIVFPGNVGGDDALAQVVKNWALPARPSTKDLLLEAERGQYAVGAFNVYNMEAVAAVVAAAEAEKSPAILQIHPSALKHGGAPLVACCVSAAEHAAVPITVHIDHGTEKQELVETLEMGVDSVMVDGSHLPFSENISYSKYITGMAHAKSIAVEAELGRLSGTEDNLTVEEYEAKLTDLAQAEEFLSQTGVDALAVCIGNVHGKYPPSGPNLRLDLLKELHAVASKKGVVLVLHGASGLPEEVVKACIEFGVRKFNVNTEVRSAYLNALRTFKKDLIDVMSFAKESMQSVVAEKMRMFASSGKAC
uniref:TSA: Wollemia nobilis Ref_Wollemi_Transcript_4673_4554 transcribed RNA sequence n=1 Tax=Wollemia nobilis TaxID=56998 RepID=A0A0C9S8F2_9CONI